MKLNKEFKILLYSHLALACVLIYLLFDLITLLNDTSSKYGFSSDELYNADFHTGKTPLIPKIIHQTYKTREIPLEWQEGQKNCQNLNSEYEYVFWTDELARNFIAEKFPWFLKTYDSYPYNIQRADVVRYFVLSYYGGIYIDLDDGCNKNLDPLLYSPAFVRKTIPTGISNDLMGSVPNHPFFLKTISKLQTYNKNWIISYITIMFSTGPLFLSVMWKQYIRYGNSAKDIVRILMPNDYKNNADAFFKISKGSSWHNDDADYLLFMSRHIIPTVIFCTCLAFFIIYLEYLFICFVSRRYGQKIAAAVEFLVKFLPNKAASLFGYASPADYRNLSNLPIVRKSRKDSNLPPANTLRFDLEKNLVLADIQED